MGRRSFTPEFDAAKLVRDRSMCTKAPCFALVLLFALAGAAEADEATGGAHDWFTRGEKGFEFGDEDGRWSANVDLRAQLR